MAAILLCALLGGVVGFLLTVVRAPTATAVTSLTIIPDPDFPGDQPTGGPDVTDRFIQTQILVLTGNDIRDAVARSLALRNHFALSAQQVGDTDLVQLTVQASRPDEATRASTAVIKQYNTQRGAALTARVNEQLAAVDAQLAQLRSALVGNSGALSGPTATEYARLLAVRSQLALISAGGNSFTRVVDQPRVPPPDATSGVRRSGIGLLVGAVVGAAGALLVQRYRRA